MSATVTILVGTMTGTAELVADELATRIQEEGFAATIRPMDGLDASAVAGGGVFLICTSTYGQGDVPDNAQDFLKALEAARPDLSTVSYGVVALGDRTYAQTFCDGGKRFDRLFAELGARRIGEPMLHDASAGTMPEEVALDWAEGWLGALKPAIGKAA